MLSWPAFRHRKHDHLILSPHKRLSFSPLVRVTPGARAAHLYVIGMSGKGKSKCLESCLYQDIAAGRGCGLIDPYSLLAEDLLRSLITRKVLDDPTTRTRLINVGLPWKLSRLEQRLGRIKRIGQARRTVDMLNLVYHNMQDEKVNQVLSRRMRHRYDIFGGLPDTIEDEWIESVEKLEEMMDAYIHLPQKARDVFELRYQETIDPDQDRCELCSRVLARRDVVDRLWVP